MGPSRKLERERRGLPLLSIASEVLGFSVFRQRGRASGRCLRAAFDDEEEGKGSMSEPVLKVKFPVPAWPPGLPVDGEVAAIVLVRFGGIDARRLEHLLVERARRSTSRAALGERAMTFPGAEGTPIPL